MYVPLYCEVNIISIGILAILLYRIRRNMDRQVEQTMFSGVAVSLLVLIALDTMWVLVESTATPPVVNVVINVLYPVAMGCSAYRWLIYTNTKLRWTPRSIKRQRLVAALPLAALAVLSLSSAWTGWLFTVDYATNTFRRGVLYLAEVALVSGYLFYAAGKSLRFYFRETNHEARADYLSLAGFVVLPAVGAALQTLLPGMPLGLPATVLSMLLLYVYFQSRLVSTDPLTELNNRRQLTKYLNMKTSEITPDQRLYILLLDLDGFKTINDKYGHVEGDRALKLAAEALKTACGKYKAFLARYGGDEFIAVLETGDPQMIDMLRADIVRATTYIELPDDAHYGIAFSMGYSVYTGGEGDNVMRRIAEADANMYHNKQQRRARAQEHATFH